MRGRIGNVVFDAPYAGSLETYGRAAGAIARLYSELLGIPLQSRADMYRSFDYPTDEGDEVDPVLRNPDGIGIAFEAQSAGYEPPRWPDPAYPQQMHVDVFTSDLAAAEELVTKLGAVKGHEEERHRTYADPVGHPFCLHEAAAPVDGPAALGRIGRIVFDCFSPRALAAFYTELLDMDELIEDSPEWVVIARSDGSLPMLGFQHAVFAAPRWPAPHYPEQVHLDLGFEDAVEARERALQLGAIKLPHEDVYTDPAGHPFCLG